MFMCMCAFWPVCMGVGFGVCGMKCVLVYPLWMREVMSG